MGSWLGIGARVWSPLFRSVNPVALLASAPLPDHPDMRTSLLLLLAGCVPQSPGSSDPDAARPGPSFMDARTIEPADAGAPDGGSPDSVDPPPDALPSDAVPPDAFPSDGPLPDAAPPPPLSECADGRDNDGDGRVDLADGDCTSPADPRESGGATAACSDGQDNDGDGATDFPADPGCAAAGDGDESDPARPPACANGIDDDDDGRTDYPEDPGCAGRGDGDEADPPVLPACGNGEDDDGDGRTDYPEDPGCDAAGGDSEDDGCGAAEVVDLNAVGLDHQGTTAGAPAALVGTCGGAAGGERVFVYRAPAGLERLVFSTAHAETLSPTVLYLKRRCDAQAELACDRGAGESPGTTLVLQRPAAGTYVVVVDSGARDGGGPFRLTVEEIPVPACRNGVDDDDDGRVDAADPGCAEADDGDEADPPEPPVCANGEDDDGDGLTDHPDDPDCAFAGGDREAPLCPGGAQVVRVGQAGGVFELPRGEGAGGSNGSCEVGFGPEVVLAIDLELPSDVTVVVENDGAPVQASVFARRECPDPETEVGCASLSMDPFVLAEQPRGTVYVFVEQGVLPAGAVRTARVSVESVITDCNDEVDNDGDGRVDLDDPGCEGGRDMSEVDPAERAECANGVDDDDDGLTDYPDDPSCVAAGDPHEGGCDGDPLWRPVECVTAAWVWSSDRNAATTLEAANAARVLFTGCNHAGDNPQGLCSLDGTGWVSVDSFAMRGCDASWYHIGGRHTGNCGGHDGDTVRHLVLREDECWDYRAP